MPIFNTNDFTTSSTTLSKSQADKLYLSSGTAISQNITVIGNTETDGSTTIGNDFSDILTVNADARFNNHVTFDMLPLFTNDFTQYLTEDKHVPNKKYVDRLANKTISFCFGITRSGNNRADLIVPSLTNYQAMYHLVFPVPTNTAISLANFSANLTVHWGYTCYEKMLYSSSQLKPYRKMFGTTTYRVTLNNHRDVSIAYSPLFSVSSLTDTHDPNAATTKTYPTSEQTIWAGIGTGSGTAPYRYYPVRFGKPANTFNILTIQFDTPAVGGQDPAGGDWFLGDVFASCTLDSATNQIGAAEALISTTNFGPYFVRI